MKLTKRIYLIPIFGLLMILGTVSCSSSGAQLSEPAVAPPTAILIPTPTGQAVDYGASLDEWDDATGAEGAVTTSENSSTETASTNSSQMSDAEDTAVSSANSTDAASTNSTQATDGEDDVSSAIGREYTLSDVVYQEILWDALVPPDFTAESIMDKYADELAEFEDGSPEAYDLYMQMQEEFNNAPINEALGETLVRIPGFIAPLDYSAELITEFLLVPYFGACIHVPPPPANQTILVTTSEAYGIKPEDSYNPVWILGRVTTEGVTTELAQAGYVIENAIIEPYNGSN